MKKSSFKLGQQFGYFTIIEEIASKHGHVRVKVKCKCGKTLDVTASDLINGRSSGCRNCKARERSLKIKIGDKYKFWVVVDGPTIGKHNIVMWKVRCTKCNEYTRLMQGSELVNETKCFSCVKCSAKTRGLKLSSLNGRVGELTRTKYGRLEKNAEVRNIDFNVSIDYLWNLFLSQNGKCALTGDILNDVCSASLDRIDSSAGYVIGNVQWVTAQANLSKHIMSTSELIEFCKKVLNHANQQPN